jgi:hypothetical protein
MYLFSVQDVKNENRFSPPVCVPSVPDMQRAIIQMLSQNPNNIWAQFPEDYRVFRVATFEVDTGSVIPMPHGPEWIVNMVDLVRKPANAVPFNKEDVK